MNFLLQLDGFLTKFIYQLPHTPFFDMFFKLISAVGAFAFIWIIIGIYLVFFEEKKDKKFIICFGLAVVLSYFLSYVLKDVFDRPRPLPWIEGYPKDFAFPSTHAMIAFAATTVLAFFDKKRAWLFWVVAILIAFSRIYLGYHYVGDVIVGAFLGCIISSVILRFAKNS